MTEPLNVAIRDALFAQLASPALTSPATPIAYPFVTPSYVPVPGTAYLDVRPIMRAQPELFGMNYANNDTHRGIFQVDAVAPKQDGEGPGGRLAALVAARFAKGTRLTVLGRTLEITSTPHIATAVPDAPWVRFPVSIPYRIIV